MSILIHYQTTNLRLLQTERLCRRQFQVRRKWQKVIQVGRKHWEKFELLVTSNFFFFHSVFKRLDSQGHQKVSLCGNGLNAFNLSNCNIFFFVWFKIAKYTSTDNSLIQKMRMLSFRLCLLIQKDCYGDFLSSVFLPLT